jgi:hypothetical protein
MADFFLAKLSLYSCLLDRGDNSTAYLGLWAFTGQAEPLAGHPGSSRIRAGQLIPFPPSGVCPPSPKKKDSLPLHQDYNKKT